MSSLEADIVYALEVGTFRHKTIGKVHADQIIGRFFYK
jgi:hypothetical protein